MFTRNYKTPVAWAAVFLPMLASPVFAQNANTCKGLTRESSSTVKITSAGTVAAGAFTPPGRAFRVPYRTTKVPVDPPFDQILFGVPDGGGLGHNGGRFPARYTELPSFCRVTATLTPTPTSDIRAEIWLPMSGWNGRFIGADTGGMGGSINYGSLADGLRDGYAVMAEDTGHRSTGAGDDDPKDAHWMYDQDRLIDFAHRAIHVTTVLGKKVTADFYKRASKYSYMRECSGASTAVMASAAVNPEDYDGLIAGAFPVTWGPQEFSQMWPWYATHETPESYIPPEKYPYIHQAVLNACDALDGVRDGVLENPLMCHWDPGEMACKGADTKECLTPAQVMAVRKIYQGPVDPETGESLQSPLYRGSELGWKMLAGPEPLGGGARGPLVPYLRNFIFREEDPNWDPTKGGRKLNWGADLRRAESPEFAVMNAARPDISKFIDRGGKLIIVNGWSNYGVPPGHTIEYYKKAVAALGQRETDEGMRLYMVPDMDECSGGAGTATFDMFKTLREWVEQRKPPQAVIASRLAGDGHVIRTRPLCPFPQMALYNGTGSTDEASNFHCGLPPAN